MCDNIERMELLVKFDNPVEWFYIPTDKNAADKGTRLQSVPGELGLNSEWLTGPSYLKKPIELWPINRDFSDRKSKVQLPMEDIRRPYREQLLRQHDDSVVVVNSAGVEDVQVGPGCLDNYVVKHFD